MRATKPRTPSHDERLARFDRRREEFQVHGGRLAREFADAFLALGPAEPATIRALCRYRELCEAYDDVRTDPLDH